MSEIVQYEQSGLIFHLRRAGYSFDDIAGRLEMPKGEIIRQYRTKIIDMARDGAVSDREQDRAMELERLDALQSAHYENAMAGDIKAGEFVLKIISMRMKLKNLDGLNPMDAQQVANILVVGGSQAEFIEALQAGRAQVTGTSEDDEKDQEDHS